MSRTLASLPVSDSTYEEIRDKLLAAGYDHAVDADRDQVSVDGIMLVRSGEPVTLKHLEAVELRPGDTLVFQSPDQLSMESCKRIQDLVEETLPGHHKVLVLGGDMKLGVLREPPPPPPPPAYTQAHLDRFLLCEELGILATEEGTCPIHRGDGCLRVYVHSKEPSPEVPSATLDWRDKMGGGPVR